MIKRERPVRSILFMIFFNLLLRTSDELYCFFFARTNYMFLYSIGVVLLQYVQELIKLWSSNDLLLPAGFLTSSIAEACAVVKYLRSPYKLVSLAMQQATSTQVARAVLLSLPKRCLHRPCLKQRMDNTGT